MQCKKPRRSNRLEVKEKHIETKSKEMNHGQLGFFSILPLELRFFIMKYLTGILLQHGQSYENFYTEMLTSNSLLIGMVFMYVRAEP